MIRPELQLITAAKSLVFLAVTPVCAGGFWMGGCVVHTLMVCFLSILGNTSDTWYLLVPNHSCLSPISTPVQIQVPSSRC